jgi:hypothetical protein
VRDYVPSLEDKTSRPTSRDVVKAGLRRGKHLPGTEAGRSKTVLERTKPDFLAAPEHIGQ